MEYRHLGKSGLKVSELTYGNWITHGSQVEEDAARSCVAAALDEGITSFDTADVYAGTAPKRSWAAPWPAPAVNRAHHRVDERLAAPSRHRLR
jgi:aryl-alcohol dehydrogenase-like predicted oxidoreductase